MAFREKAVCSRGKLEALLLGLAWQDEMSNRKWDLIPWGPPPSLRNMWAEQDAVEESWEWRV